MSDVGGVVGHSGNWTPAGGTPAPGAPSTSAPGQDPSTSYFLQHYPSYAWALNIPELRPIILASADPSVQMSSQEVQSKIEATNWWRSQSQVFRDWNALIAMDPATAQMKVDQQIANISGLANTMGVSLDRPTLVALSQQANAFGWTTDQLKQAVTAHLQYTNQMAGQAGLTQLNLRQMAQQYLVPLSDATIKDWTTQVISGQNDVKNFETYLIGQAKGMYPSLAAAIDKGQNVQQIVDPYKQIAAQTLEINPATIDWTDPKWSKAINQVDPATGNRVMMTQYDWKTELMKNPIYQYDRTEGARTQATDLTGQLAQMFGVIK